MIIIISSKTEIMSTLEISRKFQSSKERLFNAWTNPEQLKQWWKPLGKQLVKVENTQQEGGTLAYHFDDDDLVIEGKYLKVLNHEILEYSWNWHFTMAPVNDAAYRLTVHFEGDEAQSTISIVQDGFQNEESIQPHRQGWEQGLEQLKSHLENKDEQQTGSASSSQQPVIAGYNEAPEQVKVGGG
jgi:uncharacterized protein YndB with AHSA1/START domain